MKKSGCMIKLSKREMRSVCPITNTLDIIGDKWTLIVIRDLFFLKKKLFNEFLESPEKIATNILTDRLNRLEKYGIIEKLPYTKRPIRYEYKLTKRGRSLKPMLMELIKWGNRNIAGTFVPPKGILNTTGKSIISKGVSVSALFKKIRNQRG